MNRIITGTLIFALGIAFGTGIQIALAKDGETESWTIEHTPTGATGMGNPAYYILKYNNDTGQVWIAEDGKTFKQIQNK